MKAVFALIPEKGHVNPYIGPAQALAADGHDVAIAAPGDISTQILRAGLVFRDDLIRGVTEDRVTRGPQLVELIQDSPRLDQWIEQLLLGGIAEQVVLLRDWFERERPDVVVIDPLYYAAAIAAHIGGLRWASVSNSLNPILPADLDSALLATVRRLSARREAVFREHGIAATFRGCDVLSPYLTVAFATEALTGPPPPGVRLAGPSFPLQERGDEAPLRPLPSGPRAIYVSFGSQIYHWPDLFEKLLGAGALLGAHMVFSMGDLALAPRWSAPIENCHVYCYAPQLELLRRASVFVTHGGANSVMEGIACGVPMLISPMCNDQFHQAYFVKRAGVGRVCNLMEASVEQIADELTGLESMRESMKAVSASYRVNGAQLVARWIAELGAP